MNSITYLANSVDQALRGPPQHDPSLTLPLNSINELEKSNHIIKKLSTGSGDIRGDTEEEFLKAVDDSKSEIEVKINRHRNTQDKSDTHKSSFIRNFLSIILFIPNLIIIRPLSFIWYIFTFPLTLLERNGSLSQNKVLAEEDPKDKENEEDEEQEEEQEEISTATGSFKIDNNLASSIILELDEEVDEPESPKQITPSSEQQLKSPLSNTLTKTSKFQFPKFVFPISAPKKTLILDLDETLVHSISKSSRSTKNGHMIEVKISEVATLYYVHKRPYCDFFLQKASKWFDLVIFTASVKEYADPVIDWLETERKYFSKRYYRNHCTLRDREGYIKDLSTVDPNINKLIIIDNSPISYALHENNAILVEGWINDDSDQDLLNLLPLLEALKYTNDVRPLLSLKNGAMAFEK